MRGSLVHRGKNRWALVLDLGYVTDPETGKKRRKQKWVAFRGTRKQAGDKLTELVRAVNRDEFIEPSKLTLIEWLRDWLDKCIKPPLRAPETHRVYSSIVANHIAKSEIADMPLRQLRGTHLERYYAGLGQSAGTVTLHHALLSGALKKAVKDRLLLRSPVTDVEARPRVSRDHEEAKRHAWSASEAAAFLSHVKESGSPQEAAFFALALDTGARKSELHGLAWEHVDLDAGQVRIERQLHVHGPKPTFRPTKTKKGRTIAIDAATVALLRKHRQAQNELKLRNRTSYNDLGLVFARELRVKGAELGDALPKAVLADFRFSKLTKAAGVRRIKFHGLRHTSATLLLRANVPPHVVARRLGHASVTTTLETYAHVLPDQQTDAAARLGAVLHGRSGS